MTIRRAQIALRELDWEVPFFGLWPYAWQHSDVNAFYLEHGLDVNDLTWDQAGTLINTIEREEVVRTAPLRVRQVIRVDGEGLEVAFDENLDVVEITQ